MIKTILYEWTVALGTSMDFRKGLRRSKPWGNSCSDIFTNFNDNSIYINLLFTKNWVHTKNTQKNLNKLNQHATCLQISQHGKHVEHWVEQNEPVPDNVKLHAYLKSNLHCPLPSCLLYSISITISLCRNNKSMRNFAENGNSSAKGKFRSLTRNFTVCGKLNNKRHWSVTAVSVQLNNAAVTDTDWVEFCCDVVITIVQTSYTYLSLTFTIHVVFITFIFLGIIYIL